MLYPVLPLCIIERIADAARCAPSPVHLLYHPIRQIRQSYSAGICMPVLTYIEYDGTEHTVEAQPGTTVMQAAIDNHIPGIDADCGGQCACATCHVIVAARWWKAVGAAGAAEESMLALNDERSAHSRLSCQITVCAELDGLQITLPEFQY